MILSRRWTLGWVCGLAVLCLVPWIVYLHVTLPRHYTATHWPRTWVGLDLALILSLGVTAVQSARSRPAIVSWSTISATLLVSDAWFDVSTATASDLLGSELIALLIELPFAALLFWAARQDRRRRTNDAASAKPTTG